MKTFLRSFTLADQKDFAQLSGDWNPMHVDRVAARRLLFGGVVVHGVHALLWALEQFLADCSDSLGSLTALQVFFNRPLRLGDQVQCYVDRDKGAQTVLTLKVNGVRHARIKLFWHNKGLPTYNLHFLPVIFTSTMDSPRELDFVQASQVKGTLPLVLDQDRAITLFPNLVRLLPHYQLAVVLASTRLVGMECPGLHSVFGELSLTFQEGVGDALSYHVVGVDERFEMLKVAVSGNGVNGHVVAYMRPKPVEQPLLSQVAVYIPARAFHGCRVLIIGGSRGLGEVSAKVVAAGGGEVRVTWVHGEAEAERLVAELQQGGHQASHVQCDVLRGHSSLAQALAGDFQPNILMYFATPYIAQTMGAFSYELFRKYADYYVDGFERAVMAVRNTHSEPLTVFCPSTVFLDDFEPGFAEYCAAKAAAETLGWHLQNTLKKTQILHPRLPRMHTDQTVGVSQDVMNNNLDVMIRTLEPLWSQG